MLVFQPVNYEACAADMRACRAGFTSHGGLAQPHKWRQLQKLPRRPAARLNMTAGSANKWQKGIAEADNPATQWCTTEEVMADVDSAITKAEHARS